MAIADKLARTLQTKTEIRAAIEEKGQTVGDDLPFSGYPDKIRAIETVKPIGEPMTQQAIYEATRPRDWPVMPEPQDNELYLLFAVPGGMSCPLYFRVTCTGTYQVETGNSENGTFVPVGEPVTLESETYYSGELFADDYTAQASDGGKLALIKISGNELLKWAPTKPTTVTGVSIRWPILEMRGRMSAVTGVVCGGLPLLKYFSLEGPNQIKNAQRMFSGCASLLCVKLDTSAMNNMNDMFENCTSLTLMPLLDMSKITQDIYRTFYNCNGLTYILGYRGPSATVASFNFVNIARVELDPTREGWSGQDMYFYFLGHTALVKLFESLPVITSNRKVNVKDCRGTAELTEDEIAIATAKNWTVVTA